MLIQIHHHALIAQLVLVEQVGFIKNKGYGHAVGFCRCQEAVDEGEGGLWMVDGDDKECLIDIGGDDMTLFGEIGRLADDVVAAIFNFSNPTYCPLFSRSPTLPLSRLRNNNRHTVTHSHWVGAADALESEVPFDLALNNLPVFSPDGVPAASVLNDKPSQLSIVNCEL